MKSFWICCGIASLALTPPPAAAKDKPRSAAELTNVFLSPAYSQWLVGPIAQLATPAEVDAYLALGGDAEAESFIADFWERRGGEAEWPAVSLKQRFEERAAEADRRFSEGAVLGRRTARGTVFVIYGPPTETRYEVVTRPREQTLEVWEYGKRAEDGLDGSRPRRLYRFVRQGDLTVLYQGPTPREVRPGRLPG